MTGKNGDKMENNNFNDSLNHIKQLCEEVRGLRRENEKMSLRLRMFDEMMSVLHGEPGRPGQQGMGIDYVYSAEQFVMRFKV